MDDDSSESFHWPFPSHPWLWVMSGVGSACPLCWGFASNVGFHELASGFSTNTHTERTLSHWKVLPLCSFFCLCSLCFFRRELDVQKIQPTETPFKRQIHTYIQNPNDRHRNTIQTSNTYI